VVAMLPDDIHGVFNETEQVTLSLPVYGKTHDPILCRSRPGSGAEVRVGASNQLQGVANLMHLSGFSTVAELPMKKFLCEFEGFSLPIKMLVMALSMLYVLSNRKSSAMKHF
jgi:hypothetical protein